MSTKEELKTQLSNLRKVITERKGQANNSKLPGKIQKVAKTLGEHSDWGGGTYYYRGKGVHIEYDFHNQDYLIVSTGDKKVFTGALHQNGVADISLYIPGEWEKKIEEAYNKIPQVEEKREIKRLQDTINELKEEWQVEA